MAQVLRLDGDFFLNGTFTATTNIPSALAVTNAQVAAAAAIAATKLQHQYGKHYSQAQGTAVAADRRIVHVVYGLTAAILSLRVGAAVAAIGDSTLTVDLLKNGTTILSGTVTLTSSNAAYSLSDPSGFTSTALVVGDVLEVKVTVSAGTGTLAKGVFAQLNLREDAQ